MAKRHNTIGARSATPARKNRPKERFAAYEPPLFIDELRLIPPAIEATMRALLAAQRHQFWLTYGMLLRVWENCEGLRDTPMSDMTMPDFRAFSDGWVAQDQYERGV